MSPEVLLLELRQTGFRFCFEQLNGATSWPDIKLLCPLKMFLISPASDRVSVTSDMRNSCYGSLLLLDKYSKYIQCIQLHTLGFIYVFIYWQGARLKRFQVH